MQDRQGVVGHLGGTGMTLIGEQDWCENHGPTEVVDDFTAGVPTKTGEVEYHVIAYACGCDASWPIKTRPSRTEPDDYWDDTDH